MKISIVIPVYNSEKFIRKLLDSISEQTYDDYEVVIVNDGSTDNSLEVIGEIAERNKKIKCITTKNSGPGLARKRGFEESTGELLFFIDSDDWLPNSEVLEKIACIYSKNKFELLAFDFLRKCNGGESIANSFFNNTLEEGRYDVRFVEKNIMAGALWCKIFVREKMKSEYFCPYNNYEDYYTTYRYLENCDNLYYTKEILYYANRDNEGSISKTVNSTKVCNTVELLKKLYAETRFKSTVSAIMYDYYIIIRRKIDKSSSDEELIKATEKIKELKAYFSFAKLLNTKQTLKRYFAYFYYNVKDLLVRG